MGRAEEADTGMNVFLFLLHAHDSLWRNRKRFDLQVRKTMCRVLWKALIEVAKEQR